MSGSEIESEERARERGRGSKGQTAYWKLIPTFHWERGAGGGTNERMKGQPRILNPKPGYTHTHHTCYNSGLFS